MLAHLSGQAPSDTVTVVHDERRFVVRLDPHRVSTSVRVATWGLLLVGGLGALSPLLLFTPPTIAPWAGVVWLAALGGLVAGLAGFDRGALWPAPARRLGLTDDEVWWDHVDRHARPVHAPTTVATRIPRAAAALELDDDVVVVSSATGEGVVFGPLPDDVREALRTRWASV